MCSAPPWQLRGRLVGGSNEMPRNENLPDKIFDALCANPYGLTMNQLIEAVYPDPDREPDGANGCIRHTVEKMNRRWRQDRALLRIRGSRTDRRYRVWIGKEVRDA